MVALRVEDAALKAAFERLTALAADPKAALADIGGTLLGTTKDPFREERRRERTAMRHEIAALSELTPYRREA